MPGPYPPDATATTIAADLAPHIAGKIVLTTGVSPGGLGAHFVSSIAASAPKCLILSGRNETKLAATANSITTAHPSVSIKLLPLDLSSLQSVRSAASTALSWPDIPHIDVLVANAGIMGTSAYTTSPDGFEAQFAANHLGHFLLANLLMPRLLASPAPRYVSVSSDGHRLSWMRWADPHFARGDLYDPWAAYGQSKTANMLLAVALQRRLAAKGLTALSLHPGVVRTNLSSNSGAKFDGLVKLDRALGNSEGWKDWAALRYLTLDEGAATHVYASFDPGLVAHGGAYLLEGRLADASRDTVKAHALDAGEAEKLWAMSEEMVGQRFAY